jgi:hypothetical protein
MLLTTASVEAQEAAALYRLHSQRHRGNGCGGEFRRLCFVAAGCSCGWNHAIAAA